MPSFTCCETFELELSCHPFVPEKLALMLCAPTESELVETYEVARSTARRAVAALREEGLVYTVQARGTYVAKLDAKTR